MTSDLARRARARLSIALALCTLVACGEDGRHAAAPGPQVGGQSGVEGGCGVVEGGGAPLQPDQRIAQLDATPAELAALAEGSFETSTLSVPWWLDPDQAAPGAALSLQLRWLGTARAGQCHEAAELDVAVELGARDGSWTLAADGLLTAYATPDAKEPYELSLSLEAEDPELAAQLALPDAAPSSSDADAFVLSASLDADGWHGALASVREGTSCILLTFPVTTPAACDAYTPAMDGALAQVALDAPLVAASDLDVRAGDLVDVLDALDPLELKQRDGSRSSLTLSVTPLDHACSAARKVSQAPAPVETGSDPGPFVDMQEILIPLAARLRSEGDDLDVTLDAELRALIPADGGWDGGLQLYGMLTDTTRLLEEGARLPADRTGSALELLSFTLELSGAPAHPELQQGHIAFDGYAPFPGAPEYPDVSQDTTNRVACFGTLEDSVELEVVPAE